MAATLCYMNFRTGFVEDKALIKEVLTEKIGKKFKIACGSLANTGRECTPVHVMFTNKYDTRMLCRIEDTEVYELLFCNQLMELPIKDNPLPKCAMKVAPLTFDEVKSYLNSVIRLVERKPREWARRDMIKRMLRADDVDRIPCNHCPPFNSHLFSKKGLFSIKLKSKPGRRVLLAGMWILHDSVRESAQTIVVFIVYPPSIFGIATRELRYLKNFGNG